MRNILLVVLFSMVSLVGCDLCMDTVYYSKADNHSLYYGDFSGINSIKEIDDYINSKIVYRVDGVDNWEDPKNTLNRGYGDCDDFAILYLNILYIRFNIKGSFFAVDYSSINKSIVSGGIVNHAVVGFNGIVVCSQTGYIYGSFEDLKKDIGYEYSFDEIFNY